MISNDRAAKYDASVNIKIVLRRGDGTRVGKLSGRRYRTYGHTERKTESVLGTKKW